MSKVYLAGPIGKMTIEEANAWRERANSLLQMNGCQGFNPLRGKIESERHTYTGGEVVIRDKNDIAKSDIVLVYWPDRGISNGTAMEILYAYEREKIILFIGDWGKDDLWINYHVTKFMPDLNSALEYITIMFN
jgi:nucleoside 2-deoxyribosyltransferase